MASLKGFSTKLRTLPALSKVGALMLGGLMLGTVSTPVFAGHDHFDTMPQGFMSVNSVTVVQSHARDDDEVMMRGRLTGYLYKNCYEFTDEDGNSIEMELDDDYDWSSVHKDQLIEIFGEVERNMFKVKIEAKRYRALELPPDQIAKADAQKEDTDDELAAAVNAEVAPASNEVTTLVAGQSALGQNNTESLATEIMEVVKGEESISEIAQAVQEAQKAQYAKSKEAQVSKLVQDNPSLASDEENKAKEEEETDSSDDLTFVVEHEVIDAEDLEEQEPQVQDAFPSVKQASKDVELTPPEDTNKLKGDETGALEEHKDLQVAKALTSEQDEVKALVPDSAVQNEQELNGAKSEAQESNNTKCPKDKQKDDSANKDSSVAPSASIIVTPSINTISPIDGFCPEHGRGDCQELHAKVAVAAVAAQDMAKPKEEEPK